jgi:hypothetical protein
MPLRHMEKRNRRTSTDTDTLEIGRNQARVLVLGIVHLDTKHESETAC